MRSVNTVDKRVGRIETGKALRKIDGVVVKRQLAHYREDGRADIGQLAL